MKNIHIVGALHGNEPFGERVINKLKRTDFSNNLSFTIGNPDAFDRKIRFIETDLNRSFGLSVKSKEAVIADAITAKLEQINPEIIIDIHSSISEVGVVAILAKESNVLYEVASAVGASTIVVMSPELSKHSLIGQFAAKSLSLEFGSDSTHVKDLNIATERILHLGDSELALNPSIPVLKVTGVIDKNYKDLPTIENLQFNGALNGYPFLAGQDNYPDMGGFLCERLF